MKRKGSAAHGSEQGGPFRRKLASAASANVQECTLSPGETCHVMGTARLTVQTGAVWILGQVVTAHSGAVKISADARVGGPLVLEAVNASTQIPLSGGTPAILTLQSWVPPPWGEAAGDTGTGGASLTPVTAIRVRSQREQPAPENNGIQSAKPEQKELLASCTFQMRKPSEVALTGAAAAATAAPMNYCSQWRQATNAIAEGDPTEEHPAPVIAVVGSKQVGKSSFARLLINSLLGRHASVAYIDTDCGQAEFGAPGVVSLTIVRSLLTGPPHMHPLQAERSHFIGDVSPQINPPLFVRCVASLLAYYQEELSGGGVMPNGSQLPSSPLVINTHGWIKGAGLAMLTEVLQGAPLTHLVQLQSHQIKRNLPHDTAWLTEGQPPRAVGHVVLPGADCLPAAAGTRVDPTAISTRQPPVSPGEKACKVLSPVDTRALIWLAFSRCCLDAQLHANSQPLCWNAPAFAATALALTRQPPRSAPLGTLSVQIMHCAVPRHEVAAAINGMVVGLAASRVLPSAPPTHTHVLSAPPAAGALLECLGLAIVRAVDEDKGVVYILSPISDAQLQRVDTLQVGRLHLPPALLQAPGLQAPHLALFSLTADGSATRSMKSRGNLQRSGQR